MDHADSLLTDHAGGDNLSPPMGELPSAPGLKRDQDSTDDFEHLDRDGKQEEFGSIPEHHQGASRVATQSFLDMERELFVDTTRTPSVAEKLIDHLADKFTDSSSDADSPLPPREIHVPSAPTPEPSMLIHDPTPVLAPATAPAPVAEPVQDLVNVTTALNGESVLSPTPEPKPGVTGSDLGVAATIVSKPDYDSRSTPEPVSLPKPEPLADPIQTVSAPLEPALTSPKPEPETPKPEPTTPKPEQPTPKPEPAQTKPALPQREPTRTPTAHVIEAEVIFCQMGLDAWFDPQRLHPKVESVIYWRCPAQSGAALGAGLALLVALACCSVVSVLAYSSLLALCGALVFRIYKNVLQAVQKTNEGHPFKFLLEKDISVGAERAQAAAAAGTAHLNAALIELRRLFLVEDLVDSLKFGVLLWCLTYLGACFNGITLIILGWIALFTLPKAYEMNKSQVDANLELARAKINEISAKVRAAVPLGRKSDTDKDK